MKFGPVPLENAVGKILGHNIAAPDGRRAFRKGKPLTADDVAHLRQLGREFVYVADLAADDVPENEAAGRIAAAVQGDNLRRSKPTTGRANLYSTRLGLLRLDEDRLLEINLCPAVTLATAAADTVVPAEQMVATLKIIAYAVPDAVVREAEMIARIGTPLLHIDPLEERRVGLVLSGSPSTQERIVAGFEKALRPRLNAWGSRLHRTDFVPLGDDGGEADLAAAIAAQATADIDLIIMAGETAIMDRHDIAPRAVERAGGRVTCFGAPVDPGNLLMLARHDTAERSIPIIGAPGCARSPKRNIIDLVIPRLLAGDQLTKLDIVKLGHGGMLEDVAERPRPRRLN